MSERVADRVTLAVNVTAVERLRDRDPERLAEGMTLDDTLDELDAVAVTDRDAPPATGACRKSTQRTRIHLIAHTRDENSARSLRRRAVRNGKFHAREHAFATILPHSEATIFIRTLMRDMHIPCLRASDILSD